MPSFPLMKLPLLAAFEIVKSMGCREIFLISILSTRAKNVTIASMRRARLEVDFSSFGNRTGQFSVTLGGWQIEASPTNPEYGRGKKYKIGSRVVRTTLHESSLRCYWPYELVDCAKNLITHTLEVFNKPTVKWFTLLSFSEGRSNLEIIRWIKASKISIETMSVTLNDDISPASARETLEELKYFEATVILDLDRGIKLDKLDDLVNCKEINIVWPFWGQIDTPAVLNTFIKKWINLNCRLETVSVEFRHSEFDFQEITSGLIGEIEQLVRGQTFEIQGVGGKRARLTKKGRMFTMELME